MTKNKHLTMPRLLISLICVLLLLVSCFDTSSKVTTQESKESTFLKSKPQKSCLEKYAMEPCELITVEEIADMCSIDVSEIETRPPLAMFKSPLMRSCRFIWPSDRKMQITIANGSREVDVENEVMIGSFQILDAEKSRIQPPYTDWFARTYREITKEEKKNLTAKLVETADENAENKEQADLAKNMSKSLLEMTSNIEYRSIDGLGHRAILEVRAKSTEVGLNVLEGNIVFKVVVNVSGDNEMNVKVVKEVAAKVLAACS